MHIVAKIRLKFTFSIKFSFYFISIRHKSIFVTIFIWQYLKLFSFGKLNVFKRRIKYFDTLTEFLYVNG